ncbi:Uncharacterized protein HZ326_10444 [Fusarium oxysporum f. sp. albedinis]|nr:hypothetical protein FOFC_10958 [Fusarium oxysporum]KAJ0146918.1 Uncharacterized protein HZ326_10444 [Fusarium oxysporum f. sp. albedinis]
MYAQTLLSPCRLASYSLAVQNLPMTLSNNTDQHCTMLRFCLLMHDDMHRLQDVQSHALVSRLPDHRGLKEAGLAIFRLLTAKHRSRAPFNASALQSMVLL